MPGFYDTPPAERSTEGEPITFAEAWRRDEELAFGEMGLSPYDFLEMTPQHWKAKKRGFFLAEEKQWAHTRLIVAALTGQKPTQIIRLSFDKTESSVTTQEDAERILKKFEERQKQLNGQ